MLLAFAPFARTDGVPSSKAAALSAARAAVGRPSVLLFRPHSPGNIGSVARAMLNFGLTDLRVVAPADAGWRGHAEAVTNACGASPLLGRVAVRRARGGDRRPPARARDDGAHARRRRPRVHRERRRRRVRRRGARRARRPPSAPRRTGCRTTSCSARALVTIPTEPNFSSLNLAQAVLLVASEAADAAAAGAADADADAPEAATLQQLRSLLDFSEAQMWRTGFWERRRRGRRRRRRPSALRAAASADQLRRWLLRSRPSAADVAPPRALQRLAEPR